MNQVSFSYNENENNLYSGVKNKDYNNNSFRYSNNLSYKKNDSNENTITNIITFFF